MNKKAIAILGAIFILIVGTLGFLVYSRYGSKKQTSSAPQNQAADSAATGNSDNNTVSGSGDNSGTSTPFDNTGNSQSTSTPPANNSGGIQVYRLTDEPVYNPIIFYNGTAISYFNRDGEVYQAAINQNNTPWQLNEKIKLDMPIKPRIDRIIWPSQGNDYIAEIQEGSKKYFSYFNAQTKTYVDYPGQVISVGWLPAADKIMYIWLDKGKATLNISDPDTRNWQEVAEMWEQDDQIEIAPNGQSIAYYETNNPGSKNAINLVTPDGKVWQGLIKDGYNYGVLWSPDSKKFLFNKKDSMTQKYQLWAYSMENSAAVNLGLFTTLDKVVWSKDGRTVLAAVPKMTSPTAESGSLTQDDFYKIDIATLSNKIYPMASAVDARNLFLHPTSDKLFYKNLQDGYLYYLDFSQ